MMDPWLLIALVITPLILGFMVLVTKVSWLYKLFESLGNRLNDLLLAPLSKRFLPTIDYEQNELESEFDHIMRRERQAPPWVDETNQP